MMKIKKLLIFFIVYLFSLITYSNLMAYEASGYKIINKNDIYEIRLYSDRIAVQAKNNNEDRRSAGYYLFNIYYYGTTMGPP